MMNRIVLSICIIFCSLVSAGQTGIKFEHKSFEEVCKQAESENKLVFMDFYTQWCGPCLNMVKTVFILPEVGAFYNKHFVCLKMDAETKEGRALAKKYQVRSYPTYAFINPKSQEIVHKSSGAKNMAAFIEVGKSALNPKATSIYIISQYEQGNRTQEFMITYVRYMSSIYKRDEVRKGFDIIIENGGKLADPEIWALYRDCIKGYDNPYILEVSDNYNEFVKLFGKKEIDGKLAAETTYCSEDFMKRLCDFEGKAFNIRLKKISDLVYHKKNYNKAIKMIDKLIADKDVDQQKVIDRLKFMIRVNDRYSADYPDKWLLKSVEYLRYIAYNDYVRDNYRIHYDYAVALEILMKRLAEQGDKVPAFLAVPPKTGKTEYSSRPAELKQKPRYRKK